MNSELKTVRFSKAEFDVPKLAKELTALKALASRTPTPVTAQQLEQVEASSDLCNLFIQLNGNHVVGWCTITISLFEDRGHLGPIAVHKTGEHTGHGTALMNFALDYIWQNYSEIHRIDLSNRPSHDLERWYKKFGFVPRTQAEDDPTTVYRLNRPETM
jgi:GNAT superfamily N-acetyltransferase